MFLSYSIKEGISVDRERIRKNDKGFNRNMNSARDRSPLNRNRKNAVEKRVYVSNIPYEYRWQDLKDLFRNEGKIIFS